MTRVGRSTATIIVGALPLLAGALFRVWVHHDSVDLGYALTRAHREQRALLEERSQLEVERAAQRTPERLGLWAERLGLSPTTVGIR